MKPQARLKLLFGAVKAILAEVYCAGAACPAGAGAGGARRAGRSWWWSSRATASMPVSNPTLDVATTRDPPRRRARTRARPRCARSCGELRAGDAAILRPRRRPSPLPHRDEPPPRPRCLRGPDAAMPAIASVPEIPPKQQQPPARGRSGISPRRSPPRHPSIVAAPAIAHGAGRCGSSPRRPAPPRRAAARPPAAPSFHAGSSAATAIVKVGVLILFLGLAFLLRYTAERVTLPGRSSATWRRARWASC